MTIPTKPDGTTIPDGPLFRRMVDNATERPSHVAISDKSLGIEADNMRIFADLLHMRNAIRQHEASADAYISVLMPINYEFVITILAVLASGQAFAPIRFGCTAEYAISLMRRSGSTCMVYGALEKNFAIEIEQLASAQGFPIQIIPFEGSTEPLPLHIGDLNIRLDTEKPTDPDSPGMLVYISGTTGEKPKRIMHNRRFLDRPGNLPPQAVFLMVVDPIQAISSFSILTIPLSTGCQLRFISRADGVAEIWEQFRNNRFISFTTIPDTWNEMA
ncbi:putative NRPS-like protein biosynthetic cluster [Aspergillus melleus]|uniref:NRPS-like protein biosynthetic cluster n=1 Tax=Aspergillus melleus TaxID=138277 RepID=A0ACC3B3E9_9EURO|nr:putative NRPS-like protein biosynthetic cluster [Aspergillus melleus]